MMKQSELIKVKVYIDNTLSFMGKKQAVRRRRLLFSLRMRGLHKSKGIALEEIALPRLEAEEGLVLAIFGNEDLYDTLHKRLLSRKNQGFITIPLVIFSNEFFILPEGEKLGYSDILDAVSKDCDYNAVAFQESEVHPRNQAFRSYIDALSQLVYVLAENRSLSHEIDLREQVLCSLAGVEYTCLERQNAMFYIEPLCREVEEMQKRQKENNRLFDRSIGVMEGIQEDNSKNIAVTRFPYVANSSKMSLRLVLKYGEAMESILEYLKFAETCVMQVDSLKHIIADTKTTMEEYANIALVGTFSSGKTCFINTLISHQQKLRTSAGHNTAVLMEFHNAGDYPEKVILKFREQAESTLIDADIRRAQLYDGDPGTVAAVNPERCTVIIRGKDGHTGTVEIKNSRAIIVNPGDRVKTGDPLTEGDREDDRIKRYKLVSLGEILELKREIANGAAENPEMIIKTRNKRNLTETVTGKNEIQRYLTLLERYASVKESTVSRTKIAECREFEIIISITIRYNPGKRTQEIELNEESWGMFSNSGNEEIFVESPACYLNCEKLEFYLKSEFLKYCTLIDTPGLGSVTEKHDAITERYIRLRRSLLIVMLRVDIHARGIEYFWLLNLVNNVYNGDKFHKDDVIFIYNCYEDSFRDKERTIRELCREITSDLKAYGFSTKNIFACNLKKVMESQEVKESAYGYPSYKPFESRIRREVESRGPDRMLRKIKAAWSSYLLDEIGRIKREIEGLDGEEEKRQTDLEASKNKLEEISRIDVQEFGTACRELEHVREEAKDILLKNRKKKEWKENESEIREMLSEVNDLEDEGSQEIKRKIYEIQGFCDLNNPFEVKEFTFTFSVTVFMEKYRSVINAFPLIFYKNSYSEEHRISLKNFVDHEFMTTKEAYRSSYSKNVQGFQSYKQEAIAAVQRYIDALSAPQNCQALKAHYWQTLEILLELKEKWEKIEPLIDKSTKET